MRLSEKSLTFNFQLASHYLIFSSRAKVNAANSQHSTMERKKSSLFNDNGKHNVIHCRLAIRLTGRYLLEEFEVMSDPRFCLEISPLESKVLKGWDFLCKVWHT